MQPLPGVLPSDTNQPYVFRLATVPRLSCLQALTACSTSRGCPFIMQRVIPIHRKATATGQLQWNFTCVPTHRAGSTAGPVVLEVRDIGADQTAQGMPAR